MMFNTGAGTGYTISSPGAQTITLQSTIAANTHIEVVSGDHVINSNIVMAQGDPLINVAVGQKLTLNGVLSNLSGPANITFEGNGDGKSQVPTYGTLELTGLNTFTGPVVMSNYGRLVIDKVGALGQSSVDPANFVLNGVLSYTGTAATPTTVVMDRGYTVAGVPTANVFNDGFLNEIEVANANINLKITGQTAAPAGLASAFRKMGPGTLTYANTGTANVLGSADFQVGEGTVVFESGTYTKGRDNILFQWGGGNFIVGDPDSTTAGYSPTLKILNGATVINGGDLQVGGFGGATGTTIIDAATMHMNAWTYIGQGAGATGNVTISNGGNMYTEGLVYVGRDGATGHLTLTTGGTMTANNNELYVGFLSGTGTMTLSDNSSAIVHGWSQVGRFGTGTLTMTNSSTMTVDQEFRLGVAGGTGTLNMSGSTTINANHLFIGGNTDWDSNGGALSNAYVNLSGTATIHANDGMNFGANGGHAEVTMLGDSKLTAGNWFSVSRDGTSTGTLTMGVLGGTDTASITNGAWFNVGAWGNATGSLTMNAHTSINTCTNNTDGASVGVAGTGNLVLNDYASFTAGKNIEVGGGGLTGNGTVVLNNHSTMTSVNGDLTIGSSSTGVVTVNGTAALSTQKIVVGGYNGTSQLNAAGGSVTAASDLSVGYNWGNDVNDQGTHVVNATGSTISVGGSLILGANSGKGTYNQVAGHTTVVGSVILGEGDYTDSLTSQVGAHGDAVLNLNGGTFTAPGMTTRSATISTWAPAQWLDPPTNTVPNPEYPGDTGATRIHVTNAVVNFNGGLLQAGASNANFIATDDAAANLTLNVLAGGALIDTQGFDVTITKQLLGSTGDTGLKKLGIGTLTLAADPTYNGNTTVNAGTLTVGNLTHSANVYVASTGTLNATSIVTGTLTIGGPALAAASSASVTAVPEPSTLVLLVLAGLGALLAWRRK
jgi:autotransporter-associated beta strand protein/T5SS/PEP-CTERM-associated repeat protein